MAIGRTDARRNPAIPMAVTGRKFVWMSRAEPIWASGQGGMTSRRRVTGRTHDRIRTAADTRFHSPEPRWVRQDDHVGSETKDRQSRGCGAGPPGVPEHGWLAGRPQGRFAPRKGAVASQRGEAILDRGQPTSQRGFRPGQENGAPAEQENMGSARKWPDQSHTTRRGHPNASPTCPRHPLELWGPSTHGIAGKESGVLTPPVPHPYRPIRRIPGPRDLSGRIAAR